LHGELHDRAKKACKLIHFKREREREGGGREIGDYTLGGGQSAKSLIQSGAIKLPTFIPYLLSVDVTHNVSIFAGVSAARRAAADLSLRIISFCILATTINDIRQ